MFYSPTLLAKKSPMGTVWVAAHLERRIKKPQIDVIDIPSYVDCIMFPEVPIALRMTGHLLLGLVRIYSWKVNYLLQDCNRMRVDIKTVFSSVQVDLPEDADRAPFESVTLPDTFQLDALELDDQISRLDGPDNYLKTSDQITMADQIPAEGDPYVTFYINEDNSVDPSPLTVVPYTGAGPMDEDVMPPFEGDLDILATPADNATGVRDPGPSNQADGSVQGLNEGHLSLEFPEIEVMRDAAHNFEQANPSEWGDTNNDMGGMHELSVPTTNRKGSLSPIMEGLLVSGQGSLSSAMHANAPTVTSVDDLDILLNTRLSFGQPLPDLELQPSPPVEKQKPKPRKRKCFFDESLVLSNADMKKQLEDTSKLVCKRRKLPCSALDAWRFQKTLKNERIFHESVLSGMSTDLEEAFEKNYPLSRVDSVPLEPSPGPTNAPSDHAVPDRDMEPEQPRFDSHIDGNLPDPVPSPSVREEVTPYYASTLGSASDVRKTLDMEVLPTLEKAASVDPLGLELETPLPHLEEQHVDDSAVPEFPGLLNSADIEDLNFLEASNASSGSEVVEIDKLSARTRAVGQYFNEHSPGTKISENQSEKLSLNRILEGKTRKQCAIMFFETLVLRSTDYINVQQAAPYGDILITPTPKLSTAKF